MVESIQSHYIFLCCSLFIRICVELFLLYFSLKHQNEDCMETFSTLRKFSVPLYLEQVHWQAGATFQAEQDKKKMDLDMKVKSYVLH